MNNIRQLVDEAAVEILESQCPRLLETMRALQARGEPSQVILAAVRRAGATPLLFALVEGALAELCRADPADVGQRSAIYCPNSRQTIDPT